MPLPRWLADEMVGRLARYLRFVGGDVVYVRGLSDEQILARAAEEDRVLLTRDRALAQRSSRALLLTSPRLEDQWKAVRAAWPDLPTDVRFERCTECNGPLAPYTRGTDPRREAGVPPVRPGVELELRACSECGHLYWEGSHTARIRAQLAAWEGLAPP